MMISLIIVASIFIFCVLLFLIEKLCFSQRKRDREIAKLRKELMEGTIEVEKDIDDLIVKQTRQSKMDIDTQLLEKKTKCEIGKLAENCGIHLSMHKRKDQMIRDFISELNDK